jgi:hypothetical protein
LTNLNSLVSNVVYEDGYNTFNFVGLVEYREDQTPLVNTVSLKNGHVFGGYSLTLTGNYLNFDTPTISIDGKVCSISSSALTNVVCEVASRLDLPS